MSRANAKCGAFPGAQGFTVVGVYPNVGYKLGTWCTLTWYGLTLQEYVPAPQEPKLLSEALKEPEIKEILSNSVQMVSA